MNLNNVLNEMEKRAISYENQGKDYYCQDDMERSMYLRGMAAGVHVAQSILTAAINADYGYVNDE